jgi:hypothetical protein
VGKSLPLRQQLTRPTCWLSLAFLTTANPFLGYKALWLQNDATNNRTERPNQGENYHSITETNNPSFDVRGSIGMLHLIRYNAEFNLWCYCKLYIDIQERIN